MTQVNNTELNNWMKTSLADKKIDSQEAAKLIKIIDKGGVSQDEIKFMENLCNKASIEGSTLKDFIKNSKFLNSLIEPYFTKKDQKGLSYALIEHFKSDATNSGKTLVKYIAENNSMGVRQKVIMLRMIRFNYSKEGNEEKEFAALEEGSKLIHDQLFSNKDIGQEDEKYFIETWEHLTNEFIKSIVRNDSNNILHNSTVKLKIDQNSVTYGEHKCYLIPKKDHNNAPYVQFFGIEVEAPKNETKTLSIEYKKNATGGFEIAIS